MRSLLFVPLFLAACGADVETACQNYFDAYNTCATEYADANGIDPTTVVPDESICDVYAGYTDQASADLLDCQAAAYSSGDCSTSDGWTAVAGEVAACSG